MRVADIRVEGVLEDSGQVLVRIKLEEDGHTEEFLVDLWELSDADKLAEILHTWKTRIFPRRKRIHDMVKVEGNMQAINDFIESLKGVTIEDNDTIDSLKGKIKSKVPRHAKEKFKIV